MKIDFTFNSDIDLNKFLDLIKKRSKSVYSMINREISGIMERDPAANSKLEVLLLYPGLHALLLHRGAHAFHLKGEHFVARFISQAARSLTGIEIHPAACIGEGLFIDHGSGVVIGETTVIGTNVTIYQGVTLGGTGKHVGKRHPTIGNNVMIGSGAKVLGPVTIGDNSKIAAGAVVLKDIPAFSTAVGIPAKVVKTDMKRVEELDQINMPDPVAQEIALLKEQVKKLEQKIENKKESE